VTNRQIVITESDSQSLLTALKTAASLSQEHGVSLHERAASIRGGWVHDGFKAGELGAFAADRLGATMDANAKDYLRLVGLIEDALVEDAPCIAFEALA
jgi:hypothetical protein